MPLGASARHNPVLPVGADLPIGYVVAEYVTEGVLGRGGMGCVYLATHPVIGKRVAIKVLAAALSFDPELVGRFVDEARAVNKIGHRNIIDIFAFGQLQDSRHYFIMEYLEGETLAQRMEAGTIPGEELNWIVTQACSALEAAHRERIVHRDLKPENFWLARPKHAEPFLKLLDFGIAKLSDRQDAGQVTQTGTVMGTPAFMSPEQALGQRVDHRTDIYAMGVVLYRLLTGRLPFDGNTYAEIVSKLLTQEAPPILDNEVASEPLRSLVMSCLQKDPNKRPPSAQALGQQFAALSNDVSIGGSAGKAHVNQGTQPPGKLPSVPTQVGFHEAGHNARDSSLSKKSSLLVGLLVCLAVVVCGVVTFLYLRPAAVDSVPNTVPVLRSPVVQPVGSPAPADLPPPPTVRAETALTPRAQPPRPEKRVIEPSPPTVTKPRPGTALIRDNPF